MWCIQSHGNSIVFFLIHFWNNYFLCLSIRSKFSLSATVKIFPCVVNYGWSSSLHIIAVIKVIQGRCFVAYFVLSFSTLACKLSIRTTDGQTFVLSFGALACKFSKRTYLYKRWVLPGKHVVLKRNFVSLNIKRSIVSINLAVFKLWGCSIVFGKNCVFNHVLTVSFSRNKEWYNWICGYWGHSIYTHLL